MPDRKANPISRAQIALEFVIVYSFVLIIFVLMFTLISTQRAVTMSQQEYSLLQLQAQNIAGYIDQALGAGTGYAATIPIAGSISSQQFNISISTTGVVLAQTKVGTQTIRAYAFSNARNMVVNGTQTQGGNGITVYLVPIQSGSITLANSNGAIYVDEPPTSSLNLAKSLSVSQAANVRYASFNSLGLISASDPIINTAAGGYVTASFWMYWTGGMGQAPLSFGTGAFQLWIPTFTCFGINSYHYDAYGVNTVTTNTVLANTWVFVTAVLYNGAYTGNSLIYINGQQKPMSQCYGSAGSGAMGNNVIIGVNASNTGYFGGNIANLQIYNMQLPPQSISQLYHEGMSGAPLSGLTPIGWWPLNGNTRDYGGHNYTGTPTNMIYATAAQLNAHLTTGNGANAISAPIGFVTSSGSLGQTGNSVVLYTNATGSGTAFVSSGGFKGIANLTTHAFNDNITTVGNLVGWWPLDEGYGSIAYDISGRYDNGAFATPMWAAFANQTNLAAANFNGQNSNINVGNSVYPTNGQNTAITISAWVAPLSTSTRQAIIKKTSGSNVNGWLLGINTGGSLAWYIYTTGWQGNWGFTTNTIGTSWSFVACTWDGHTMGCYINGVKDPNTMLVSGSLSNSNDYTYIGQEPYQGASPFNGLISNVQLYNTALQSSQITQLYGEGISGSPIGDAGIVSWWPLDYSANDYSNTGNNGVPTNVVFGNVNYTNPTTSGAMKVASFNGVGSYISSTMPTMSSNSETQVAWVYLKSLPSLGTYSQITWQVAGVGGLYVDSSGHPLFGVTLGSTVNAVGSSISIGTGQWHMLSGSYSGSALSICIDGASCLTTPASGALGSSLNPFYIGANGGIGGFTNGEIADVQLYNTALTQTQIRQIYQQGLPLYSRLNVSLG